jgi:hypothetical protein
VSYIDRIGALAYPPVDSLKKQGIFIRVGASTDNLPLDFVILQYFKEFGIMQI